MSMHLEGPWLTTTVAKRRGKKKCASAAQKQQAQQYQSWLDDLNRRYPQLNKSKKLKTSNVNKLPDLSYDRSTRHIPSLNSMKGSTAPAPKKVYTGDKLVGIGTMHKSNMVPIFSDQEAKDISTMRRN